jgi:hypothetical protein
MCLHGLPSSLCQGTFICFIARNLANNFDTREWTLVIRLSMTVVRHGLFRPKFTCFQVRNLM